jgi:hypothetical protein
MMTCKEYIAGPPVVGSIELYALGGSPTEIQIRRNQHLVVDWMALASLAIPEDNPGASLIGLYRR